MSTRLTCQFCSLAAIVIVVVGSLNLQASNEGAEKTKQPVSARIDVVHKIKNAERIGNVVVKYADGTEDKWTLKGNCSTPNVSPSGVVGWIVYALQKDGKSIEIHGNPPNTLAVNGRVSICEKGRVLATVSTTKAFIEGWGFTADGRHFVVKSRGAHGPASVQLFAFQNGPAEATVAAYADNLPAWARPYKD